MAMCNKRFIHSSSISLQRFASLHYLPLHYTSIHFTIYFAPHSKSIPSFHIAKPTLCFPCLGFCFAYATMFFVLNNLQKTQSHTSKSYKPLQAPPHFLQYSIQSYTCFFPTLQQYGMLYFFCDI
jgi:hypothetical protein